jgi:hypothetical protein
MALSNLTLRENAPRAPLAATPPPRVIPARFWDSGLVGPTPRGPKLQESAL